MHIVVTTDFSPESRRVFRFLELWARRLGGRITLFHVVSDLQLLPGGSPGASPLPAPAPREELQQARKRLEEEARMAGIPDVEVDTRVSANVARAIVDYAAEKHADLLIMASHGRSGLRRLMLGSVTEEVLRHSHTPILCVPPEPI